MTDTPNAASEPFYFSQPVRFVDQLSLVALDSAVSVARHFVKLTLAKWRALSLTADAALVVSELTTNASAPVTGEPAASKGARRVRAGGRRKRT